MTMFVRGFLEVGRKNHCAILYFMSFSRKQRWCLTTWHKLSYRPYCSILGPFLTRNYQNFFFFLFCNYSSCSPVVAGHTNGDTCVNMASVVMSWQLPFVVFCKRRSLRVIRCTILSEHEEIHDHDTRQKSDLHTQYCRTLYIKITMEMWA